MADSPNIRVSGSLDDQQMQKAFADQTRALGEIVKALDRAAAAGSKVETSYKGISQAERDAAREQQKFLSAGARITAEVATPTERYNATLARLNQHLKANTISQTTYNRAARQAVTTLDAAKVSGDRAGSAVGTFVAKFAGVGTVMTGMMLMINTLKKEWQDLKGRQGDAATTQKEYAPAIETAVKNAGGFYTGAEVEKIVADLHKKRPATSRVEFANILAGTMSSMGVTNKAEAKTAVDVAEAAAGYMPLGTAEEKTQLASTAAGIVKNTGLKPKEAVGYIQSVGNLANIRDPKFLAQSVGPAVLGLIQKGFTREQAGSLFSTYTQRMQDPTGQAAATGSLAFAERLSQFRKTMGRDKDESMQQTMDAMQADPKLRKLFLEGGKNVRGFEYGKRARVTIEPFTGEAKAVDTGRSLVGAGDAAAAKQYKAGLPLIGTPKDNAMLYSENIVQTRGIRAVRTAIVDKVLKNEAQSTRIDDVRGGEAAVTREGIDENLKAQGIGELDRRIILGKIDWSTRGKPNFKDAIAYARKRQGEGERINPKAISEEDRAFMRASGIDVDKQVKTQDTWRLIGDAIERQTKVAEEQKKIQQQMLDEQKKQQQQPVQQAPAVIVPPAAKPLGRNQ